MRIHGLQWGMIAFAWLCGAVYLFGNTLAQADFSGCIDSYATGLDWATSPDRPANWTVWRMASTFLVNLPELALGGAVAIIPLTIFLLVPRRRVDAKDWIVLALSVVPLFLFALTFENGHDCDRKGNDYLLTGVAIWAFQIAFILVGLIISVSPRVAGWIVEQMKRP